MGQDPVLSVEWKLMNSYNDYEFALYQQFHTKFDNEIIIYHRIKYIFVYNKSVCCAMVGSTNSIYIKQLNCLSTWV